jgi:hypothetical protein
MRYILLMNTMNPGASPFPGWSEQDLKSHIAFMNRLNRELRDSGELVSAESLSFSDQAKLVRAGKDGEPVAASAPPDSKEFLSAYWIVDVDAAERVYAIAARISAAPGRAGAPLRAPIEVRPLMSEAPVEL